MILPENKKIIIFDGVCNLCIASVQFIIKHDRADVFRFASNQSLLGKEIIKKSNIDILKTDSIILFDLKQGAFTEAKAAFYIAKELNGIYHYIYYLKIIPKKLANFAYKFIAKNRYKWFGKTNSCLIPSDRLKAKFLS